ncbi:DegT/DnrJ/EryC1/StrS family aminotransferase [Gammaproteobacteria bacterium]|nr:DegT/DnrJ/EryC1/StrS family aminotransferase [Gammaproteobacteria bacterium]
MKSKSLYVTQPSLPDLSRLTPLLENIWKTRVLSNKGPYHDQLEEALCKYLDVPYISLVSNGTLGLIIALKALNISGNVITTPYTFAATAHSIMWNNLQPLFVDIDRDTLNLDPTLLEQAITPETTAIMPVHVYGNPCADEEISRIANKYGLKVIYDSSHAFGVKCASHNIFEFGDLSVLSFHATKVFNTFEGGAIICRSKEMKEHIDQLKNFGFTNEISVEQIGINGKMNEFSAAIGLLQLENVDADIEKRKSIDATYRKILRSVEGVKCFEYTEGTEANYSYFPIFINSNFLISRDELYHKLKDLNIFSRRYFYPIITELNAYKTHPVLSRNKLSEAYTAAECVLCLPIFSEMTNSDAKKVANAIISMVSSR